jgi:hypothetical protein
MAERAEGPADGPKHTGALRIAGVVVLALAAVGIGAVRMGWIPFGSAAQEESVLAKTAEPTSDTEAPVTVTEASSSVDPATPAAAPAASAAEPPATARATGRRSPARLATATGGRAATVSAVTPDAPRLSRVSHVDEHVTYQYNAMGRRDPFQSLITGEFLGHNEGGDAPPDPGGMRVVGIVWGATDQFAMVEDARGNSYVLRKGDKLQNGFVEALRRDAVVVVVTADGQSQQVVIPFVRKGEGNGR